MTAEVAEIPTDWPDLPEPLAEWCDDSIRLLTDTSDHVRVLAWHSINAANSLLARERRLLVPLIGQALGAGSHDACQIKVRQVDVADPAGRSRLDARLIDYCLDRQQADNRHQDIAAQAISNLLYLRGKPGSYSPRALAALDLSAGAYATWSDGVPRFVPQRDVLAQFRDDAEMCDALYGVLGGSCELTRLRTPEQVARLRVIDDLRAGIAPRLAWSHDRVCDGYQQGETILVDGLSVGDVRGGRYSAWQHESICSALAVMMPDARSALEAYVSTSTGTYPRTHLAAAGIDRDQVIAQRPAYSITWS